MLRDSQQSIYDQSFTTVRCEKNILKNFYFYFFPHYLLVPVLRASLLLLLVLQLLLQFLDLLLEEVPLMLPIDSLLLDIKKKPNKQINTKIMNQA